jgi:hypothetical protein
MVTGRNWKTARMATDTLWCFQCGASYDSGVAACVECGVGLVEQPPLAPEEVGDLDDEQIAYEFHDWAFESRRMLDQLLTGRDIPHAWQGASMIVRVADEETVDALVDEVEVATLPTLDADVEHTVYEMEGWTAENQTELSNRLGAAGVAHEFDVNGDLVVHADEEARVDEILDEIEARGGRSADGDDDAGDLVDMDGLDVNELLSTLFDAADRLRRNARDAQGVLKFLDNAPTIERMRTPFGFEPAEWRTVRDSTTALHELLDDDESDDADVRDQAQRLRDLLFRLI